MSASTTTTVAFVFKRKYSDDKVGNQTKRDHLLLEMAPMREGCGGEDFRYMVRSGNGQGVSATFSVAQSGASSSKGVQFATQPVTKYGVITIDGPSLRRSKGNQNAIYDLVTMETDGILEETGDSIAFDLYRSGNGQRGQRLSASTNVITMYDAEQARNFKEGMTVIASANADGSSARTGDTTVTAVDEDAGTVTLTSAAAITSFADDDYLFRKGDPALCCDGLEVLNPLAVATTIRGATVTGNTRRYQGVRIDNTARLPEENASLLGVKIRQGGKRANCMFVNPITFHDIQRRRDAKVEFQEAGGTAGYGFEYLMLSTPGGGIIKCYSDPDCPENRLRVGKMDGFQIRTVGKFNSVIAEDGRPSLREATSDGIEVRTVSMHQPVIMVPGEWGVASV